MKKEDIQKKKAVALKYTPEEHAPKVIATGKGYVAQKIMENAQAYNVPTYKDKSLVEELTKLNLGDNIPQDLYQAVAQVLVFINNLDKEAGRIKYAK